MIECTAKLNIINNIYSPAIGGIEFFFSSFTCVKKLEQDTEVIDDGLDSFKVGYPMFVGFDFFQYKAGPFGICPEIRVMGELFFFFKLESASCDVKDTSLKLPPGS
jgi:hypothetical protein